MTAGSGMVRSMGVQGQTEGGERLSEFRGMAHRHDREILGPQVLAGDPQHIGLGHGLDGFPVLEDEILRVAVVLIAEQAAQRLGRPVEVEDEAVERGLLGGFQLLAGDLGGADAVQLLEHHLDGLGGGRGLGAAGNLEQAGVVVGGAPLGADAVGVTQLRAEAQEQAAGEPAAEDVGHDLQRRLVCVAQQAAQVADREDGLRHVVLGGQEDAGLRFAAHGRKRRHGRLHSVPTAEQRLELGFHLGRGEIAVDRQQDVGGEEVPAVERDQVVAPDARQGVVFDAPAVRRILAVDGFGELAGAEGLGVVVAARDLGAQLGRGEVDFVLPEPRAAEHVPEDFEHRARVFPQCGEADLAGGLADRTLHRRGHVLKFFVELVSGLCRRAAGAHDHAGQGGQPDFVRGIEQVAGAHQRQSAHQRQFMVLEQVDPQAVAQGEGLHLGDVHRTERREAQLGLLPQRGQTHCQRQPEPSHFPSPFGAEV